MFEGFLNWEQYVDSIPHSFVGNKEKSFITHNMKGSYAPHNLDLSDFFCFKFVANSMTWTHLHRVKYSLSLW